MTKAILPITAIIAAKNEEKNRRLKGLALRVPCEPQLWFIYHYFLRLACLEGGRG